MTFLEQPNIARTMIPMLGQAPLDHIKSLSIVEKVKRVLICLGFYTLSDPLEQEYESDSEQFQEDFQKILNQRNTVLQEFKVRCDQQESNIINFLSNQSKIPTEKVTLEVANSRQAMQIFSVLDEGPLKSIDLKLKNDSRLWDYQRFIQVWRDKEGLEMEIILEELMKENMECLKKILTNSRTFRKISIYFEKIDLGLFNKFFGQPSEILENSEIRKTWISREESLRIHRDLLQNRIQFSREPVELRKVSALEVFNNSTILGNVAKFLNGIDMQSLRKVCKGLRFGLDSLNLDPNFKNISIEVREPGQVTVIYNNQKPITYREFDSNESYQSKFLEDFKIMMSNQETVLNSVYLNFYKDPQLLDHFKMEFLKIKGLKVENLELEVFGQHEIVSILSFIDSGSLKKLEIKCPGAGKFQRFLSVDEISKLDQWRNLEELVVNSFVIYTPISELSIDRLALADILMDTVSMSDLIYLKEKLHYSKNLIKIKLGFQNFFDDNDTNLDEFPGFDSNQTDVWYFRIPNSEKIFYVFYNASKSITFSRVELYGVPENARVL
ncbi:unnamed protein product [Caenorhabditis nigoni]